MRSKIYIQIVVGISLLILTSAAGAQDEQWLQYHSEREAQRIVGDMGTSNPTLTSEKPQGVELPQFKSQQQFFAQWSTPMVESGQLWIALDRTNKQGQWYRLERKWPSQRRDRYHGAPHGPIQCVFWPCKGGV